MVLVVQSQGAEVGQGLACAGHAGGLAAANGGDKVGREREASRHHDGRGYAAAGVDHVVKGLLRKEGKGVALRQASVLISGEITDSMRQEKLKSAKIGSRSDRERVKLQRKRMLCVACLVLNRAVHADVKAKNRGIGG